MADLNNMGKNIGIVILMAGVLFLPFGVMGSAHPLCALSHCPLDGHGLSMGIHLCCLSSGVLTMAGIAILLIFLSFLEGTRVILNPARVLHLPYRPPRHAF